MNYTDPYNNIKPQMNFDFIKQGGEKNKDYSISNVIATDKNIRPNVKALQLRPYQQDVISDVRQAISDGAKSVMVQLPTGSGKSVVITQIIDMCKTKNSTVLLLVHREELLYQSSALLKKYGIEHGIIKAGQKHESHHRVQIASIQTVYRRLDNPFISKADVVIIDEAHHSTAMSYRRVIDKLRKKILLGFSATPVRKNGLGLGNLYDRLIQVTDIQKLTDLGYLVPIRYVVPVRPDFSDISISGGDYSLKELEEKMLKSAGVVGDIVGNWLKFAEWRKTIIFTTSVKHSLAVCKQFRRVGIVAEQVDGKTPREERAAIMERFRTGNVQVIVNCQVFTEGVDVPDIGCVMIVRPTKSLCLYMQMIGRGMRPFPNKTDCIVIDHASCVYEHGFVHEINDWKLSSVERSTNTKQQKRKLRQSEPICCPVCSCMYTGQLICPECGNTPTLKQFSKDIEYIDGVLGELVYKQNIKPKEPTFEEKIAWYSELKLYAELHGYNLGWVSHKYHDKFDRWPNSQIKQEPAADAISQEVATFIKHANIKFAKTPAVKK